MYQHNINNFDNVVTTLKYWYSDYNKYAKLLLQNMDIDDNRMKNIKINSIKFNNQSGCIKFNFYDGNFKKLTDIQNLQVKLVSNKSGFNQIDKRWVETYQELWKIPSNVVRILKHFTGELEPYEQNTKDSRRMFVDELSKQDQEALFGFLKENQTLIINDILKGRGKFSAEWMLVIIKDKEPIKWVLKPINEVLNFFGNGEIKRSPRGGISIGKITMQRKGGDNGRPSANMLQFKIDPTKLLEI
jgi:hypothetical protein